MVSMVERVSRALAEADTAVATYDELARAAIEAMRDPDVEMIAAFWRQKNCGTQEIGKYGEATSDYDAYRAMIDAALAPAGDNPS